MKNVSIDYSLIKECIQFNYNQLTNKISYAISLSSQLVRYRLFSSLSLSLSLSDRYFFPISMNIVNLWEKMLV